MLDILIIGAGPVGLSCAIEAEKSNLKYIIIEKGCITNSILNFPTYMTFFSTPDLLEIGDIPFISPHFRPERGEALHYYRKVVDLYALKLRCYEKVINAKNSENGFEVISKPMRGEKISYKTNNIIVATGYYDNSNMLYVKGEERPKVTHYYSEGHQYHGMEVAVIGANNSATETAIDLYRQGAKVTLIHRGKDLGKKVKYWIAPELKKRLDDNSIKSFFNSEIEEIKDGTIVIKGKETEPVEIKNDFVFAMTGYRPDVKMLKSFGIKIDEKSLVPNYDKSSFETNVKGIFLAGSVQCGLQNNQIFIETGRFHGKTVIEYIKNG